MQFKNTGALLVKDIDTRQGIVQAYWSAFGNKDDGSDIVVPGAWKKSIAERGPQSRQPRIKFLYQHQETMLLGIPSELVEDATGLLATSKIVPTTLGQDVLLLYAEGVISEHSVGYEVVQAQWDAKQAARLLIECILWEGSAVTWGMNSQTPTVSVKALTHEPEQLTALATRAARIDSLLHNGRLRSDALCETLERELKSLHAALAPTRSSVHDAHAADVQPYTIQGVIDTMADVAASLSARKSRASSTREIKGASGKTSWPLGERDASWDNGAAHKRIVAWATKDDDSVDTSKLKSVHFYSPDGDDAEDVSKYKLLFCDVVDGEIKAMPKALMACWGGHGVEATSGISDADKAKIKTKLSTYAGRMRDEFDDDSIMPPWDKQDADDTSGDESASKSKSNDSEGGERAVEKGASVKKLLVKGTGGDIEVSADGTHAAYTGEHEHDHKTMGDQGGDKMHGHKHAHKGDAKHDHEHEKAAQHEHVEQQTAEQIVTVLIDGKRVSAQLAPEQTAAQSVPHKARDFDTIYAQDRDARDLLSDLDDLTDTLEDAMCELLLDNGGHPMSGDTSVETILSQFEARVRAWFAQAQLSDTWDDIADMAQSDAEWMAQPHAYYDYWCSNERATRRNSKHGGASSASASSKSKTSGTLLSATPADPEQLALKAGRALSSENRETITKALNGIAEGVKTINEHHSDLKALMEKTDPDRVRQDEDDTQGDDDTENGGTNVNKSRDTSARAASYTTRADTTAPRRSAAMAVTTQSSEPVFDLSALDADFDALKSRVRQVALSASAH